MAVTTDILRSWRGPRAVMRDHVARGQREDRAFAFLMTACLLIFVGQWPRLARVAETTGQEFDRLVAYEFFAWLIVWPLGFYLIAAISWALLKVFRSPARPYEARLALFWSFLAATPAGLLYGLTAGFLGPADPGALLVGLLWIAGFLLIWAASLREISGRSVAP